MTDNPAFCPYSPFINIIHWWGAFAYKNKHRETGKTLKLPSEAD